MMIPLYVAGKNYRKFPVLNPERRLFPRGGLVAICGPNGAGKTTLLTFIEECLFGVADKEDLRYRGAASTDPVLMLFVFELNGQIYRVQRKFTGANLNPSATLQLCSAAVHPDANLLAVIENEDVWQDQALQSAQAVTRAIEELLGMTAKEFERTLFSPQGESSNFLEAPPREKEDFIARATGIDGLKDVERQVSADATRLEARIEGMVQLQQDPETLRAQEAALGAAYEQQRQEAERLQGVAAAAASALQQAQTEFAALRAAYERDTAYQQQITRTQVQLEGARREHTRLESEQQSLETEQQWLAAHGDVLTRYTQLVDRDRELNAERLRHQSRSTLQAQLEALARRGADRSAEEARAAAQLAETEQLPAALAAFNTERQTREQQRSALVAQIARLESQLEQSRRRQSELQQERGAIAQLAAGACCPTCRQEIHADHRAQVLARYDGLLQEAQTVTAKLTQALQQRREMAQKLEMYYQQLLHRGQALEQQRLQRERLMEARSRRLQEQDRDRIEQERLTAEMAALGDVHYDEAQHRAVRGELQELQPLRDQILTVQDRVNRRSVPVREELAAAAEAIGRLQASLTELTAARSALHFDRAEYERKHQAVEQLHAEHLAATSAHQEAVHQCDRLQLQRQQVLAQIREQQQRAADIDAARQQIIDLRQLQENLWEVRRELLAEIVPDLNRLMSGLVAEMTQGRYTLCRMDPSYNLFIYDGAHLVDVRKSFSGGEKLVASLAFRLALNRYLTQRVPGDGRKAIFLDEVLANLDSERKDAVVSLLRNVADIDTIYLIHHDPELAARCDAAIRVEPRADGGSQVIWENAAVAV